MWLNYTVQGLGLRIGFEDNLSGILIENVAECEFVALLGVVDDLCGWRESEPSGLMMRAAARKWRECPPGGKIPSVQIMGSECDESQTPSAIVRDRGNFRAEPIQPCFLRNLLSTFLPDIRLK